MLPHKYTKGVQGFKV